MRRQGVVKKFGFGDWRAVVEDRDLEVRRVGAFTKRGAKRKARKAARRGGKGFDL